MGLDADFLGLLTAQVTVFDFQGEDTFGNSIYSPARTTPAFVNPTTTVLGSVSGQDRQDSRVIHTNELIMDATGITPGSKIVLPGGRLGFVTSVVTDKDEFGEDLYQTVTITSTEEG